MISSKQLWILAGGNGAGMSTFYDIFLADRGLTFINADLIAKDTDNLENSNYNAATIAEQLRYDLLEQGISYCYETVFSHASKIDFVGKAIARGYEIILAYIHLDNPELNEARVYQRVAAGGHNVPIDKIYARIPRTMKYISKALPLVSEARLLNNSCRNDPFKQVAVVKRGECTYAINPLPDWAETILKEIPTGE